MILPAVPVARIHDDARRKAGAYETVEHVSNARGVVVRARSASAEHDVAVGIPARLEDGRTTVIRDSRKHLRTRGRADRVDRALHVSFGGVLEPDGHRQSARQLPVDLALRRPRPDRSPTHRVGQVLRRDRIEELAADGKTERQDLQEKGPRRDESVVHPEAGVEPGIVDEPLPPDRRTRFLEVHAHHDLERTRQTGGLLREPLRVVERRGGIVNRTGPDDDEQPVVGSLEDRGDGFATGDDRGQVGGRQRQRVAQLLRGDERAHAGDAPVVNGIGGGHGGFLTARRSIPADDRPASSGQSKRQRPDASASKAGRDGFVRSASGSAPTPIRDRLEKPQIRPHAHRVIEIGIPASRIAATGS